MRYQRPIVATTVFATCVPNGLGNPRTIESTGAPR